MTILIDGYNLINATDIPATGRGIGGLERSRLGLLHFLVEVLEPAELAQTTVVFDARNAPPGLPRVLEYRGLTIRFAARYENADALIAELVAAETSPRSLVVVSSDHAVQREARHRRARAVDSEIWHDEMLRRARSKAGSRPVVRKPPTPLPESEVLRWLERFGGESLVDQVAQEEAGSPAEDEKPVDLDNPFPPGYGEDLLDGER